MSFSIADSKVVEQLDPNEVEANGFPSPYPRLLTTAEMGATHTHTQTHTSSTYLNLTRSALPAALEKNKVACAMLRRVHFV